MSSVLEEQKNKYFDAIVNLTEEEDIINSLPIPEYSSFFELINGILDRLEDEKNTLFMFLNECDDELEKDIYREEIDLVNFKIDICKKRLNSANEIVKEEELGEMSEGKRIIFASTSSGNTYYQKDLKDLPDEYVEYAFKRFKTIKKWCC